MEWRRERSISNNGEISYNSEAGCSRVASLERIAEQAIRCPATRKKGRRRRVANVGTPVHIDYAQRERRA